MTTAIKSMPVQSRWDRKAHKMFPALFIPWGLIATHDAQAKKNHAGQDLSKLASRGGLSACEAIAIIQDRDWTAMDDQLAHKQLAKMISDYDTGA